MQQNPLTTIILVYTAIKANLAAREVGKYLIGKLGNDKFEYQKAPRDDLLDANIDVEHILRNEKLYPLLGY